MANLFDILQRNTGLLSGQKQGVTDQTTLAQNLLRAKSGKSVSGGDVAQSNLGEQSAVSQANQQLQQQVAPQAQIASQQLQTQVAGQQQEQQAQQANIAQARNFDTLQNRIKVNSALSDLERNKGQVDAQRYQANLQLAASTLRLQSKQYVDSLTREGNINRLNNQNEFNQKLEQSVLGNNRELLQQQLGNKAVLDAKEREFKQAMNNMDIDWAYKVLDNTIAQDKQQAMYGGIGAITTAGVGAYGTYANSQQQQKSAPATAPTKAGT